MNDVIEDDTLKYFYYITAINKTDNLESLSSNIVNSEKLIKQVPKVLVYNTDNSEIRDNNIFSVSQ